MTAVEPGQVWTSANPRRPTPMRVVAVAHRYALVETVVDQTGAGGGRRFRRQIRLDRFQPIVGSNGYGYLLVTDAPAEVTT